MILSLTKELGVNRAGVDIILRMRRRLELMQREMGEMMEYLDSDVRRLFERRLRRLFEEE